MNGNGWVGYPPVVPHWRAHWPVPVVDQMRTTIRKIHTDARDADWIARELGDVPRETITGWRSAAGTRTPWHGYCIPVESLGRDA